MILFEWDEVKAEAEANIKKHDVSFEKAKTVFYDEFAIQFYDDTNSQLSEDRFLMLGLSSDGNLLLVCHCERKKGKVIRIISARKAKKNESQFYGAQR